MKCTGDGVCKQSLTRNSSCPYCVNSRPIRVVHAFRNGKRHGFLRIFLFFPEGCRHDRGVLSVVTSHHTRDDSVMFVNSLLWCFRQMWWVERQEIHSVMSSPIKKIIGNALLSLLTVIACWFSKYQQYVKCFQETCKKQLFPQIIYSHGRLSSAGVHVYFPFFIALFHRNAKKKSVRTFSVVKWRENERERRTATWVGSHYLFDLLRGKFR